MKKTISILLFSIIALFCNAQCHSYDSAKVSIPRHVHHKVKKVLVKNVINKANYCHVSIYTNKEVAKILYHIGLGQSTGSGFGTIYKTENHSIYQ